MMKQNLYDTDEVNVVAEAIPDAAVRCTVLNVLSRDPVTRATLYKVHGTVRDAVLAGSVKGYSGTIRVKTTIF